MVGECHIVQCPPTQQAFIEHLLYPRHCTQGIQQGARPTRLLPLGNSQADGGDRPFTGNKRTGKAILDSVKAIIRGTRLEATLSGREEGARLMGQLRWERS